MDLMQQDLRTSSTPFFLVSVRNAIEALAALTGGCDVLDVKEPSRGSMGMADVATITSVVEIAKKTRPDVAVSAALGDLADWAGERTIPVISDLDFVKLGPLGQTVTSDWIETWHSIQRRFDEKNGLASAWVAVAYVDSTLAAVPTPETVVKTVVAARDGFDRCAGVLFDTYAKTGRSLFDWISQHELISLANQLHCHGLILAVAGSLHASMLESLREVQPDIIAVRAAVCEGGQRTGAVTADAVRNFATSISSVFETNLHT